MWRDDAQAARACIVLLARARLEGLFSERGPNERARALLQSGAMSTSELIMLKCAMCFWNSTAYKGPDLGEMVDVLDDGHVARILGLILALKEGAAAIDTWITMNAPPARLPDHTPEPQRAVRVPVVHRAPPYGSSKMACCRKLIGRLPLGDTTTADPAGVTCKGPGRTT